MVTQRLTDDENIKSSHLPFGGRNNNKEKGSYSLLYIQIYEYINTSR